MANGDANVGYTGKGKLHLIQEDIWSLYDLKNEVEDYLALFASFDEWCKQHHNYEEELPE